MGVHASRQRQNTTASTEEIFVSRGRPQTKGIKIASKRNICRVYSIAEKKHQQFQSYHEIRNARKESLKLQRMAAPQMAPKSHLETTDRIEKWRLQVAESMDQGYSSSESSASKSTTSITQKDLLLVLERIRVSMRAIRLADSLDEKDRLLDQMNRFVNDEVRNVKRATPLQ